MRAFDSRIVQQFQRRPGEGRDPLPRLLFIKRCWNDESRSQHALRRMGPCFRRDDGEQGAPAFATRELAIAKPRIDLVGPAGHSVRAVSLNGRKSRRGYRRIEFCSATMAQLAPAKGAMAIAVASL